MYDSTNYTIHRGKSGVSSPVSARFPPFSLAEETSSSSTLLAGHEEARLDAILMARIVEGDKEAWGYLFQRYTNLVRTIAARILKDATEAEDLVQDLFLFIQQKCCIFDGSKSSVRSWIVQMAYHRAIDRRRYLTARQFYSRTAIEGDPNCLVGTPTAECDYSAEAVFGRNGLSQVLKSLSEDQRETLRLHFFDGYTLAEISERLGQPLGTVRHHYYRGLDKLRKQMFANTVPVDRRHAK